MKILIVSDTHGGRQNFEEAVKKEGKPDMLIHLGDVEGGERHIEAAAGCPSHILGGNNDVFSRLPGEKEIYIGKYRAFLTHGHKYRVRIGEEYLKAEARKRGVDIVMYGHTHVPALTEEEGLVTLNPGSLTYPRQPGGKASYITMEIDERGEANYKIHYLS